MLRQLLARALPEAVLLAASSERAIRHISQNVALKKMPSVIRPMIDVGEAPTSVI
jgi:hypothetical protein